MSTSIQSPDAPSPRARTTPDLSPLGASVRRFHGWEPLTVEGSLPTELRGSLVRAGPGLMERFGRRLVHAFEADGALIGLRLRGDGTAQGSVRVVESPGYMAEEAARRPLFGSAAPWWRRFTNGLQQRVKATGNTSVMSWQDRAFALMEGARPVEIDPESLATLGVSDMDGLLGPSFSAHPRRLAAKGVTFNFGQRHGPKPALDLYALPDAGPGRRLGAVDLPFNTMIHDFAITERYLVFVISSLKLKLGRALLAPKDMVSLMEWHDGGAQLLIVPIDAVDKPVRIPIAPRFVFHLANAHERGEELVIDVIQYPDLSVLSALATSSASDELYPPRLQRLVATPKTATLRSDEQLWDETCEFPVLTAGDVGTDYSGLWLIAGDEGRSNSLVHLNVETQTVDRWETGEGIIPSEGVFIPNPSSTRATAGWIASLILDGWTDTSYWAILDSEHLADGPIATIGAGQPLPTTYHGTWFPS